MLVLAALGGVTTACGDDEAAVTTDVVATSLPTLAEWCATFADARPALASPNPDGREVEILDLYIADARALAAGAPGVTAAAMAAAEDVADTYAAIRQRVADGEALPDVLTETFAGDDNELVAAAETLDTEAEALC